MKKDATLFLGLAAAGAAVWYFFLRKDTSRAALWTPASSGPISATPQSLFPNTAPIRNGTQGFTFVQPRPGQGGTANGGGLDSAIALGGNVTDLAYGLGQMGKDLWNGTLGKAFSFLSPKTGKNVNDAVNQSLWRASDVEDFWYGAANPIVERYDVPLTPGNSDLASRSFSVSDPIFDTPTDNVVWPADYWSPFGTDTLSYSDSPYGF